MSGLVSNFYFAELAQKDPLEVCQRLNCKYDLAEKCYTISVWNDYYAIFPNKKKIKRLTNNLPQHHPLLYVFIMYLLSSSKSNLISNEWISEKDLFGGVTFFRGPHEIQTKLISNKFSNDIEKFRDKCQDLEGTPINMGDAAYIFKITDNIVVALVYWLGDNVFESEVKLLFDKSIDGLLPLDIVFSLALDICVRFVRKLEIISTT